ncbi:neuralized-like protein 4 isoform X1 [Lates japonicus]|uniref:Neuralized-like protein 4 isoform X1 n=1 Tax=Lates japonicus TaxID=270547 RepID=A0AAD3NF27_LATJO|nr:neuralized-like protein 4 isoform X1 [Lates japonicus]
MGPAATHGGQPCHRQLVDGGHGNRAPSLSSDNCKEKDNTPVREVETMCVLVPTVMAFLETGRTSSCPAEPDSGSTESDKSFGLTGIKEECVLDALQRFSNPNKTCVVPGTVLTAQGPANATRVSSVCDCPTVRFLMHWKKGTIVHQWHDAIHLPASPVKAEGLTASEPEENSAPQGGSQSAALTMRYSGLRSLPQSAISWTPAHRAVTRPRWDSSVACAQAPTRWDRRHCQRAPDPRSATQRSSGITASRAARFPVNGSLVRIERGTSYQGCTAEVGGPWRPRISFIKLTTKSNPCLEQETPLN